MRLIVRLIAVALLVVGERGGAGDRAEQEIVAGEELRPRRAHAVAGLVGGEPVTMRQHGGPERAGVVALVVRGERADEAEVLLELGVALPVGRRRAQEPRVDRERLAGVDGGTRAVVDLRPLSAQEIAEVPTTPRDARLDLVLTEREVIDCRDR